MPPIGTRPDCVHCHFMVRQSNGEYRCRQHDMTLHSPVKLFCKQISPPTPDDDAYRQWFEDTLDTNTLEPNTLYTWVDTTTRDAQGTLETHTETEVIAPLTSYMTWAAGTFWQVLRSVRQNRRDFYEQHGYKIED